MKYHEIHAKALRTPHASKKYVSLILKIAI
jgi:hypothetical protein